MVQQTDVVIDGIGFTVVPGTYKRRANTEPETRPGKWKQTDFVGGQRRAFQLESDRGWDSEGTGPGMFGQGVEPWPSVTQYTDSGISGRTVSTTSVIGQAVAGDRAHYANGRYVYETPTLTGGSWSGMNQVDDGGATAVATDQCQYRNDVITAFGSTVDIRRWNPTTNTASVWIAGRKANLVCCYQGELFYSLPTAGSEHILQIDVSGTVDTRKLDSPIVRMALHQGQLVIATRTSIYLMSGKGDTATSKWTTDPIPLFTGGIWTSDQDYQFLCSFGGKLYTWLAGQVMEFNPNGGSTRQGWRATGVEGRSCYGGVVTGGYLIVSILTRAGDSQTWAFDGSGWWMIEARSTQSHCWPLAVAGAGTYDLILFRSGSSSVTYDIVRLVYRDATNHSYRTDGAYRTSLLDMGEPDTMKAWQRIGASFATPEQRGNPASTDTVTVSLTYSTDNGVTFTTAATASPNDPTDFLLELDQVIAGGAPESRMLMVRVTWSSVSDWAPTLAALWVEYDSLNTDKKQRRWSFDLHCRDQTVQRDGSIDSRTGRAIAADLWSNWEAGNSLTFRDVDYDAVPTQRSVRIFGIEERIPKPSDQLAWSDSIVSLVLVEL